MPGQGKYTTYVPVNRRTLLEKLFKGDDKIAPPFYGMTQEEALKAANEFGDNILKAGATDGYVDTVTYGPGTGKVDLTYQNRVVDATALEVENVKWTKPGDPANPYVPDISSPGPGKTDGVDKEVDPKITITDVKPNYVKSANTASPTDEAKVIYDKNKLLKS